ncbi:MAG: 50S ribosomal protein L29 [Armatimonadota bacterium]|nr:50S ribosomal protein L29 [Armatimonadota bacterium]MDR7518806.1 50S ribosomal protein L29 [Armatimonadota bacterium]MDR7549651.1 50S ribosomal protein L29 [Armatimonadota bacterium]
MALKASMLREMTEAELAKRLQEAERELWALRIKVSQQRNTARIGALRRDIARLKTVLAARTAARRVG